MKPCEVGFNCPRCVGDYDGDLCCVTHNRFGGIGSLDLVSEYGCPLVEESSELYDWLQVMDDPTVQLAIEKANKVKDEEAQKLCDKMLGRRMRIEEQERKADRNDPF